MIYLFDSLTSKRFTRSGRLLINSGSLGSRYVSKYSYLIVNIFVSHLSNFSVNFFLVAPFPDHYLLVPFNKGIDGAHHFNFT